MPVYEYRCLECRWRFSVFWRTFSDVKSGKPACPRWGAANTQRLVSLVRVMRSEETRWDDMADPSAWGDFDENDPKSMGRMMRKMMSEMGDEAGDLGSEFEEVVGRLESGQDPEQIEKEVPGLMEGADGGPMPDLGM